MGSTAEKGRVYLRAYLLLSYLGSTYLTHASTTSMNKAHYIKPTSGTTVLFVFHFPWASLSPRLMVEHVSYCWLPRSVLAAKLDTAVTTQILWFCIRSLFVR